MIARGDELESILEGSCRLVEEAFPGSLAIVLLLDGKRLRRGAAPSFPKYMAEVDGFEIDPAVGTCSAAAARREQVISKRSVIRFREKGGKEKEIPVHHNWRNTSMPISRPPSSQKSQEAHFSALAAAGLANLDQMESLEKTLGPC
jgi:hypothetical protein